MMADAQDRHRNLASMAFGSALEEFSRVSDGTIERLISRFEDAAQSDGDGEQIWFARDLQRLLGYAKWDNFLEAVERAKSACKSAGHTVDDHFADAGRMVVIGSGAEREIDDIILSRYACYLIAQNGDPRKQEIAFSAHPRPHGQY